LEPTELQYVFYVIGGLAVGFLLSWWVESMSQTERRHSGWTLVPPTTRWKRGAAIMLVTAILFTSYLIVADEWRWLDIEEVQPTAIGRRARLIYHLTLICFLIAATAVDFDCYIIPDQITIPGTLVGVLAACALGELQLCHWWVDWVAAIPHLRGPTIPAWYDTHRILHALAWSLSGLAAGAIMTWIARWISSRVLGQEAMGLGDVTLMAMIGSFVGWQAIILVFLFAPLAGLTVGVLIKLISGKTYLPYGPWLSLAAGFVLFRWAWLWDKTRLIFSDWLGMAMLAGIGAVGFVALLILVRLYRAIPGRVPNASRT
jgi:leader peptidase (prepilin peptidase)/N-methyltransferase